jgi:leucyl/phenylalanyl-tRNA---protein transferase
MLYWVNAQTPLPSAHKALSDPNGLVAAGSDLGPDRVLEAYRKGIFPWFSEGQPVLWWSPDPRMVLQTDRLRVTRSLKKTLRRIQFDNSYRLTTDTAFEQVLRQCAAPREHQDGTWITEQMIQTYVALNQQGYAHSIELWHDGELVGGLYGLCIGKMFYGESMFSRESDASKVTLVCLSNWLLRHGCPMIDCQQNTSHLASFGAFEISRTDFLTRVKDLTEQTAIHWPQHDFPFEINTTRSD